MHPNENDITWDDFKEGFHGANIPKSIMKIKKREFDDLKQRKNDSVRLQWSIYSIVSLRQ